VEESGLDHIHGLRHVQIDEKKSAVHPAVSLRELSELTSRVGELRESRSVMESVCCQATALDHDMRHVCSDANVQYVYSPWRTTLSAQTQEEPGADSSGASSSSPDRRRILLTQR